MRAREGERVYREVRRSRGSRTLTLPSGLDATPPDASFENGLLVLTIPRAEQAKPRQISITPGHRGDGSRVDARPPRASRAAWPAEG